MTKQLDIWKSDFGVDWTNRTKIDPKSRIPAFMEMLRNLDIKSILEVGCGKGHNLVALSQIRDYKLVGIDPLEYAIENRLERNNIVYMLGECCHLPFTDSSFDLVFTCGVLMHIAPEGLSKAISELVRVASRYILVIEYYSKDEVIVPYREHDNLLWKRSYKYLIPNCIREGFWAREDGFDNTNWWLFKK